MKNYFLFTHLLFFGCIITFGQETKTTISTKTKNTITQNISSDAIRYANNKKEEEIILDGKDIIISGSDNKLNFKGTIGIILITGNNNDITIESVNQINLPGNGNFVSWEKSTNASGKPKIQDKGGYNNVGKRSNNAFDKADE